MIDSGIKKMIRKAIGITNKIIKQCPEFYKNNIVEVKIEN